MITYPGQMLRHRASGDLVLITCYGDSDEYYPPGLGDIPSNAANMLCREVFIRSFDSVGRLREEIRNKVGALYLKGKSPIEIVEEIMNDSEIHTTGSGYERRG